MEKNSNAHSNKLTTRQPFIAVSLLLSAMVLSPVFAQSSDDITLPDLGTHAANTSTIQPNINAQGADFTYHDNIDGKKITLTPQYNQQNGTSIGGSLSGSVTKNMAVGVLLSAGSDRNEWLLNTGFDLTSNQRFIFSLGQLRQKQDFNFISGKQKAQVRQDNIAGSYQYFLGKDWLNAAEINAYISNTGSVTLGNKTYFTDTTSLYELWSDPRRIAGGRVSGVQGRLVFTPTSKSTIKLGFGGERLTYDLLTGNDSTTRATGSAEFNQRLDHDFNFRASANAGASQSRYALGLGKSFKGGSQLGLDVATIRGRDNTFNDNQVMLSYTQSFGGGTYAGNPLGTNNVALNNHALNSLDATGAPINQASANTATPNPITNTWTSSLVDQVSRRPSFLPSQVIAKIDTTATPTRLIAIDKTAVPVGSSINTATGVITAPTGTPVSGIASVTKNAVSFTNAGQFALFGTGLLVVNPNLITQPAVGLTETYVVTMNNSVGGGTTLATVVVSHGSVKIDSIVMTSGIITPTLTGLSLSSTSVVFGTAAPTITAPTSASSGAITYTSGTVGTATITSDGVITLVGVGTTVITATQAASGNYASSTTTITLTVTVTKPTLSGLGLSSTNVVFGTAAPTITAPTSASSGAITYTSDTVGTATITSDGVITLVGVGTTVITATQAASGNYASNTTSITLTVTAATPTLTGLSLSSTSVAFGTAAPTITAPTSASSGAITYTSGTVGTATITSGGVITLVGVGTTVITATQAANGNYASTTATITLTVTGITPTLTGLGLSATSVAFGTAAPTITVPTSASNGAITYASGTVGTATITSDGVITLVGVGTTVITATQAASGNYASTTATITLTVTGITPTLTGLGLSATSVAFGTAAPTITVPTSASNGAITYTSGTVGTATITSDGVITLVGVGTTVITATQAASGNYASSTTSITLTVTVGALPVGAVVSGGLTWTRNNSTVAGSYTQWAPADSTCSTLTAQGLPAGSWRLPTLAELSALYAAGTGPLTSAGWTLVNMWTATATADGHNVVLLRSGGAVLSVADYNNFYVSCVH